MLLLAPWASQLNLALLQECPQIVRFACFPFVLTQIKCNPTTRLVMGTRSVRESHPNSHRICFPSEQLEGPTKPVPIAISVRLHASAPVSCLSNTSVIPVLMIVTFRRFHIHATYADSWQDDRLSQHGNPHYHLLQLIRDDSESGDTSSNSKIARLFEIWDLVTWTLLHDDKWKSSFGLEPRDIPAEAKASAIQKAGAEAMLFYLLECAQVYHTEASTLSLQASPMVIIL
ncbi:hypothetical protein T439DRAFT_334793 [Meredithblackwellia eburnea MCA 4105]